MSKQSLGNVNVIVGHQPYLVEDSYTTVVHHDEVAVKKEGKQERLVILCALQAFMLAHVLLIFSFDRLQKLRILCLSNTSSWVA